jgi:hypothetical protein
MAGGPLHPYSQVPVTTDKVFPHVYVETDRHELGMGVMASLDANAIWRLRFEMPGTLPSGTAKLRLRAKAPATSGDAKVNPKWKPAAPEENIPAAADLTAEGTTTITWASGDNVQEKEAKVTLDASDAIAGGDVVYMDLTFETTNWTLAQISAWWASIIWE